jgi:hypothetical protein
MVNVNRSRRLPAHCVAAATICLLGGATAACGGQVGGVAPPTVDVDLPSSTVLDGGSTADVDLPSSTVLDDGSTADVDLPWSTVLHDGSTADVDLPWSTVLDDGSTAVVDAGPACRVSTDAAAAPFVPSPSDPLASDPATLLSTTAAAMAGTWAGTAHAPWDGGEVWNVTIAFTTTSKYGGQYSATGGATTMGFTAPAFYYGSDLPCDLKAWQLLDVQSTGIAGTINVTFEYPPEACYLPTWQGELSSVALDASLQRLNFSFTTSDGYGPIVYDLARCD